MKKNSLPNIKVKIQGSILIISQSDKQSKFDLKKISPKLAKATQEELSHFSVSPSNYGIHWTMIDEDISIPALLNEPREAYNNK